ncbi:hypothetical protein ACFRQM_50235, partial [Streptomyces sp. NPDC056831]|uniref:hypothetical protein n=1 Tax=Streptomyces sp. NPDC056831 TaxID=3345954 RepID=UPI0036C5D8CB
PCSSEAESWGKLLTDDNAAGVRAQPRDAAPHLPVGLNIDRGKPAWAGRDFKISSGLLGFF